MKKKCRDCHANKCYIQLLLGDFSHEVEASVTVERDNLQNKRIYQILSEEIGKRVMEHAILETMWMDGRVKFTVRVNVLDVEKLE